MSVGGPSVMCGYVMVCTLQTEQSSHPQTHFRWLCKYGTVFPRRLGHVFLVGKGMGHGFQEVGYLHFTLSLFKLWLHPFISRARRHIFEEAFGYSCAACVVQPAAFSHRVIVSADGQQSTPRVCLDALSRLLWVCCNEDITSRPILSGTDEDCPCVSNIASFRGVAAVIKSPTVSTYFLELSRRADLALDRACLRAAGVLDSALEPATGMFSSKRGTFQDDSLSW